MTGKTHMLGGLMVGTGLVLVTKNLVPKEAFGLASAGAFMVSSTVTALLPDVDEKNSTAGRRLIAIPITLFLLKVVLFLIELVTFGNLRKKIKATRKALNHRRLFHWIITWSVLSIICIIIGVILYCTMHSLTKYEIGLEIALPLLAGFIPGYLSHLLLDIISGRIQLLAPFSKKWYGAPLFEVGGFMELYILRPLMTAGIIAMLSFFK